MSDRGFVDSTESLSDVEVKLLARMWSPPATLRASVTLASIYAAMFGLWYLWAWAATPVDDRPPAFQLVAFGIASVVLIALGVGLVGMGLSLLSSWLLAPDYAVGEVLHQMRAVERRAETGTMTRMAARREQIARLPVLERVLERAGCDAHASAPVAYAIRHDEPLGPHVSELARDHVQGKHLVIEPVDRGRLSAPARERWRAIRRAATEPGKWALQAAVTAVPALVIGHLWVALGLSEAVSGG